MAADDTCPSCEGASYPRFVDMRILLPVNANDGRPLAPGVLERYLKSMANRWGGVTVEVETKDIQRTFVPGTRRKHLPEEMHARSGVSALLAR